jgi:hypothetical protein
MQHAREADIRSAARDLPDLEKIARSPRLLGMTGVFLLHAASKCCMLPLLDELIPLLVA